MNEECTQSNRHENLASMLEGIPQSNEDAVSLRGLCKLSMKSDPSCDACSDAVLGFLRLFEVIRILNKNQSEEIKVKARSEAAYYFLRSLAVYLRQGLTLATNWERRGVRKGIQPEDILSSGTQLVYLMEHRRIKELGNATPIRSERVSQVIIKARLRGRLKHVYLVQYDADAQQFQFIGGRMRPDDSDELMVMKREISEELKQNDLLYERDYELEELAKNVQVTELSPTYGAYSEYVFTFYRVFIRRQQLKLAHSDKWVTLDDLRTGETKDGQRISNDTVAYLDKHLDARGGLKGLPLSLQKVQSRPLMDIIKERRWELFGLVIAFLGILLSVIFFLSKR